MVAVRDGEPRDPAPGDRGRSARLGESGGDRSTETDARAHDRRGGPRRCGTVGRAGRAAAARAGRRPEPPGSARRSELVGVAVRRPSGDRGHPRRELLTTDAAALVARDDVDVVVEVIGGIEPARDAAARGAQARASPWSPRTRRCWPSDGGELRRGRRARGRDLYFEAAVAGAIPLIRPLRESLAGDRINRVARHRQRHHQLHPVRDGRHRRRLRRGARRGAPGWATPRPTRPPTSTASTPRPRPPSSPRSPSTPGSPRPTCTARASPTSPPATSPPPASSAARSSCWRSASASPADGAERVSARVYPAMSRAAHPLAAVDGAFNAVFVEAEAAGQLMFYGQGAGGAPTASAVLGDLVAVARNRVHGGRGPPASRRTPTCRSRPMGELPTRYHVSLDVADRAGVLAAVAAGSPSTRQHLRRCARRARGDGAPAVVVTHRRQRRGAGRDRRRLGEAGLRARGHQRAAGGRGQPNERRTPATRRGHTPVAAG